MRESSKVSVVLLLGITLLGIVVTPALAKNTKLEIWHPWAGAQGEVFTALLQDFRRENPDLDVSEMVAEPNTLYEKLLVARAGGIQPDIAWGRPLQYMELGIPVTSVDGFLNQYPAIKKDVMPNLWPAVTKEGRLYGMPIEQSPSAVNYNTAKVNEAGLPLPSDLALESWTWNQFSSMGKKLSRDTNGDGVNDQWGFNTQWKLRNWEIFLRSVGGEVVDNIFQPTKPTLVSEAAKASLKFLMGLVDSGVTPAANSSTGIKDQKYAMDIDGVWNVSSLKSTNISFGSWLPPRADQGKFENYIQQAQLFLMDTNDRDRMNAAWRFMAWFYSPSVHARWVVGTGYLPVMRSALSSKEFAATRKDPAFGGYLVAMDYGTVAFDDVTTGKAKQWAVSSANTTNVLALIRKGDISIDEGLNRMQQSLYTALKD